jgi:TPR repeat protein
MTDNVTHLPFMVSRLTRMANAGDVECQFQLGLRYLRGDGVVRNGKLAQRWLNAAARADHPLAWVEAGTLAAYGAAILPGAMVNTSQAVAWYEKARLAGDPNGGFRLALLWMGGTGWMSISIVRSSC